MPIRGLSAAAYVLQGSSHSSRHAINHAFYPKRAVMRVALARAEGMRLYANASALNQSKKRKVKPARRDSILFILIPYERDSYCLPSNAIATDRPLGGNVAAARKCSGLRVHADGRRQSASFAGLARESVCEQAAAGADCDKRPTKEFANPMVPDG